MSGSYNAPPHTDFPFPITTVRCTASALCSHCRCRPCPSPSWLRHCLSLRSSGDELQPQVAFHRPSIALITARSPPVLPPSPRFCLSRSLWRATAQQIGREARALYNRAGGGLTYWAQNSQRWHC